MSIKYNGYLSLQNYYKIKEGEVQPFCFFSLSIVSNLAFSIHVDFSVQHLSGAIWLYLVVAHRFAFVIRCVLLYKEKWNLSASKIQWVFSFQVFKNTHSSFFLCFQKKAVLLDVDSFEWRVPRKIKGTIPIERQNHIAVKSYDSRSILIYGGLVNKSVPLENTCWVLHRVPVKKKKGSNPTVSTFSPNLNKLHHLMLIAAIHYRWRVDHNKWCPLHLLIYNGATKFFFFFEKPQIFCSMCISLIKLDGIGGIFFF